MQFIAVEFDQVEGVQENAIIANAGSSFREAQEFICLVAEAPSPYPPSPYAR